MTLYPPNHNILHFQPIWRTFYTGFWWKSWNLQSTGVPIRVFLNQNGDFFYDTLPTQPQHTRISDNLKQLFLSLITQKLKLRIFSVVFENTGGSWILVKNLKSSIAPAPIRVSTVAKIIPNHENISTQLQHTGFSADLKQLLRFIKMYIFIHYSFINNQSHGAPIRVLTITDFVFFPWYMAYKLQHTWFSDNLKQLFLSLIKNRPR